MTTLHILYFLHTLPLPAEIGSDAFQKFLNLLGDKITLKGWTGYRGGLDTKSKLAHLLISSAVMCITSLLVNLIWIQI